MTRVKLPPRRANETRRIKFVFEGDKETAILITIGFADDGTPQEVFCADFKAGTTLHGIVMDACILLSRLMQHGDTPAELLASMCGQKSLIAAIAEAVADSKGPDTYRDGLGRPVKPRPPAPADAALRLCREAVNV
jgi:hypothetical protein